MALAIKLGYGISISFVALTFIRLLLVFERMLRLSFYCKIIRVRAFTGS